jgi:hypothetical protein
MKISEKEIEITTDEIERMFLLPPIMVEWFFRLLEKITKIKVK